MVRAVRLRASVKASSARVGRLGPLVLAALVLATPAAAESVTDLPCVPEPRFPDDCVQRLGPIGDAVLDPGTRGFRNVVAPLVDPLLLLATSAGRDGRLYAVHPTADRVRVFDTADGLSVLRDIETCRRPGALAQSLDGHEVYVACHGSAGVAVIDTRADRVVDFIQDRDADGRPRLAEPMGMAVRGTTLYVASSYNDRLAVVDLKTRRVRDYVELPGRDPRSLTLAGDGRYLVVAAFLAGNRTEPRVEPHPALTDPETAVGEVCAPLLADPAIAPLLDENDPRFMDRRHPRYAEAAECYLFGHAFGSSAEIVREPRRPDHDLVVVDLQTLDVVFTTDRLGVDLGAVNYHVATDPAGRTIYLVSTAARNDLGHGFGARPVENRLSILALDPASGSLSAARTVDLDAPGLASGPDGRSTAAIPAAIALLGDRLLIAALGSDALVTTNLDGTQQAWVAVGFGPRGIVTDGGAAYVYNATGHSVSRVDPVRGRVTATALLGPSPLSQPERLGARLFHSAGYAPRGNFACASCHPDGHQDGLVWELNDRDGLRATLPVNGIAETAPYHWDGSKCNLHDIVQDSVADLFRNPAGVETCEQATLIAWMNGLARPASPHRATDDRPTPGSALGSLIFHRGRFKGPAGQPLACSGRAQDPAAEAFYLEAQGDRLAGEFRFNGGGGPVPSTRSSESCSLANCHVAPLQASDGFRSGDPTAGLVDGFQAVSTDGVWDRASTQHDARTTRTAFLRALEINREHHGASPAVNNPAQAFNDANFRHAEYHFDDRPDTHGYVLADALTEWMQEGASPESGAVGLVSVLGATGARPRRTFDALIAAADQGKLGLEGVGTLRGAMTRLTYRTADARFVADDGSTYAPAELRASLSGRDTLIVRGVLLPQPGGKLAPRLISLDRATSPIRCSEGYDRYPATVTTGETDAALLITADRADPETRVVVDGRPAGGPLVRVGDSWTWKLPRATDRPTILTVRLLGSSGLLSNALPLPVVGAVRPAVEPGDLVAGRRGRLTEYRWGDQFGRTGPGTSYDVFRGDLSELRAGRTSGECVSPADWFEPAITDGAVPEPGEGLFFLVRAQNQLGATSWGGPQRNRRIDAAPSACALRYDEAVPETR